MNYSVRCPKSHALRCVSALCENWSSVSDGFRDPLPVCPAGSVGPSVTTGAGQVKVHTSFCDLDATVELFKSADCNDGEDVDEHGDDSAGDSGVSSSHFHSADDGRKSYASNRFCRHNTDDNFVMLDSEISVKRVSKPPLAAVGCNSSFSGSRCSEVGSTFVTTAVDSHCAAVNREINVAQMERVEYGALKLGQVPVSVSSTVCDVDSFSVAETDTSEEVILLGDDDGVVTSSDCIMLSERYSDGIATKDVGDSGNEFHVSFDADETLTYTHPSNRDVLAEMASDVVSTSTVNDENDGFVANKPVGEMGSIVSRLVTDCVEAGDDVSLTKTSSDTVFANAVSCESEQLVSEQHSSITKTSESIALVDICNNDILAASHGDVELSARAASYENDGFALKKAACGTETVDTTTCVRTENCDELIETDHITLSDDSDVDCENDTLVVDKSVSVVEHTSPADGPDQPDITPDVDTVIVVDDDDDGGQTVGSSRASNSVNMGAGSCTDAGDFATEKPAEMTVSAELNKSTRDF